MRKWLEGIALLSLGLHLSITIVALFGSEPVPVRFPVAFDDLGQPTRWGSSATLLALPAATMIIYLLLTVVTSFPGSFQYPVRVTARNRVRLQDLALDMMAWLKAEVVGLLTWMQWATIEIARSTERTVPPMSATAFVAVFATLTFYVVMMFNTRKQPLAPVLLHQGRRGSGGLRRVDISRGNLKNPQTAKQ